MYRNAYILFMLTVILKLSGEPVPPGLTEVLQSAVCTVASVLCDSLLYFQALSAKDLSMIAEFLKKRLHKNVSLLNLF